VHVNKVVFGMCVIRKNETTRKKEKKEELGDKRKFVAVV